MAMSEIAVKRYDAHSFMCKREKKIKHASTVVTDLWQPARGPNERLSSDVAVPLSYPRNIHTRVHSTDEL